MVEAHKLLYTRRLCSEKYYIALCGMKEIIVMLSGDFVSR